MANVPKWSTPDRQAHLIRLFVDSGGFCVYGHKDCLIASHHYEYFIEKLISNWVKDDRELAVIEWQIERKAIHNLCEPRTYRAGRFGTISREIWYGSQPLFYIEAVGMSGLRLKPFAKVKLPSSQLRLHVNLGDTLRGVSKNRRRKAIRHNKPLPSSIEAEINRLVTLAVSDYFSH